MMSENEREVKEQEKALGAMALGFGECGCGWFARELWRRSWGK